MNINHAILHVFDFESGGSVFSQAELDLTVRQTKSFVQRHLRKCKNSPDNKHGEFVPESAFAPELAAYLQGQRSFCDLSVQVAQFLSDELRLADPAEAADLLVVDFDDDVDAPAQGAPDAGEVYDDMPGAPEPDAFEGQADRCFAMILLPRKPAFVHDVCTQGDATFAEVLRTGATLPNPTQKVDTYAIVNTRTLGVEFSDKPRSISGAQVMVIPDALLQCTAQASTREVIDTVTRVVADVAQEYGAEPAVALAKAKAYVSESAGEGDVLLPWDVGDEVFEDAPEMQRRYREEMEREELPEQVNVKRQAAARMAKNHRIRTDTGIEITFPAEYGENPEFMQFVREPDGRISIELKNIREIENK